LLIDALRADHLSSYGYRRQTTPAIDALARDGVLFRQAIAQSTFTKSSIATLFTGRYPFQHGVYWGSLELASGAVISDVLPEEEICLAEELRERGYLTAAWVQNSHLRQVMGFGQGFVSYRDSQGSIERIHRKVRPWLRGAARRYPFFAYLHYIDLHDPYRPPPPYDTLFGDPGDVYGGVDLDEWGAFLAAVREGKRRLSAAEVAGLEALYDGQLRHIDDEIGRLFAELRALGLYDRSLIVVTADHGDGFMEHGFISHSTTPYEELVRVPLVVKLPGGRFAGTVVERQVRLADVMPTILDAVGARRWPRLAGCSLLPLIAEGEWFEPRSGEPRSGEPDAGDLEGDCDLAVIEIAEEGAYPVVAIRRGGWKYIHHQKRPDELYDLARDPGERVNRLPEGGEAAAELERLALEVVARRPDAADRVELDEQAKRELKALGYLE
jgi:arylsulfatase A-like enzyme